MMFITGIMSLNYRRPLNAPVDISLQIEYWFRRRQVGFGFLSVDFGRLLLVDKEA
jgi:hypothetical protein